MMLLALVPGGDCVCVFLWVGVCVQWVVCVYAMCGVYMECLLVCVYAVCGLCM